MVSYYAVRMEIKHTINADSLQDAINGTFDMVKTVFNNTPTQIDAQRCELGYMVKFTFGFQLRGIDIEDASKRAYKLLFDTFRSKPTYFVIDSHTSGCKLEYIEQEFRLERIE